MIFELNNMRKLKVKNIFYLVVVVLILIFSYYSIASYDEIKSPEENNSNTNTIFKLKLIKSPLDNNISIKTDEHLILYGLHKNDSDMNFPTLIDIDFEKNMMNQYVSYIPENINKYEDLDINLIKDSQCSPHGTVKASDNIYYTFFWGKCNYFYKIDTKNLKMEIITTESLGLDNGLYFDDTYHRSNDKLYLSVIFGNDIPINRKWFETSLDLSDVKEVYSLDYSDVKENHDVLFHNNKIYNALFTSEKYYFKNLNRTFENRWEFIDYFSEKYYDNGSILWDKFHDDNDYELLNGHIMYIDLENNNHYFVNTTGNNPGHLEIFEDYMYVSNHQYSKLKYSGKAFPYLFGPATIDKFIINDNGIALENTFRYELAYRITSHKIGKHKNYTYVSTVGFPNRLIIINGSSMKIDRLIDLGEPVLEGIEDMDEEDITIAISKFIYSENPAENRFVDHFKCLEITKNGKYVIAVSPYIMYIYDFEKDVLLKEIKIFDEKDDFSMGSAHTNLV
jgi:hypothetical protein